ncbi:MAG: hypothetical protein L0Z53_06340 [Acidobacteriales bacterium]|nr:hypothetical protein [Terriglobales bacterium]
MNPALLIAGNFLREQRWFVVFLLMYVAMLSLVYGLSPPSDVRDLLVLEKQLAGFALLFNLSIVTGSLQQERRTRRIVAVLSKGISRREYIAGFLLGSVVIAAIYCAGMAASAVGLHRRIEFPLQPILELIAVTLIACVLTNTIALFFATSLHPLFAMLATGLTVGLPFVLAEMLGPAALNVVAVAALLQDIRSFSFGGWTPPWLTLGLALLQTILFWLAAAWVFSRRDVAVAVE